MSFHVYILRCADTSYYTGHTDNLEKRLAQHHTGAIAGCYTFKRRPLELVFSQDFPTREEALASEQQIKGWSRKKKEAMMRGDWAEVSRLAKSTDPMNAEPPAIVRAEPVSTVQSEPPATVRAELVEAHHNLDTKPSVHPSTGSGRTEGGALP